MSEVLEKLAARIDLSEDEAHRTMEEIMTGKWSDVRIAGFLMALRTKGETTDELVGFARVMRDQARSLWEDEEPLPVLDTCGTGGDNRGTFNISTAAAFVAAGAGATVAKHGNRAASSRTGSADVLEALGVDIDMTSPKIRRALQDVGIAFLFAQSFHSSMRFVMPARRELGVRTVFNILGPLANPARARYQVIGVASESVMELMASAVARLGVDRAFVVRGHDGLDEASVSDRTDVIEVSGARQSRFMIQPEDVGVERSDSTALAGGDAAENARIIEQILAGEKGPPRDAVLMNAGLAIAAARLASGFADGVELARQSIDSGRAAAKLAGLRALSAA